MAWLPPDAVYCGDARELLARVQPASVSLAFWSPPYLVGKQYERDLDYSGWVSLLDDVVRLHERALAPGAFLVVNIADILCFKDPALPKVQARVISSPKRHRVTEAEVRAAQEQHPELGRSQLARLLGCSEQTIQRRLEGSNARGGKYETQTRVLLTGPIVENAARVAGLYLYDQRFWAKDPAWANCRWTGTSLRAVDEVEHLYVFVKPGETVVDRARLEPAEWGAWGSRQLWQIPSVRRNDAHEAMFPLELARRVIRLYTDPGQLVLDCFAGSGTTAVAASELGRHYLAIEREQRYVDQARGRIAAPRLA